MCYKVECKQCGKLSWGGCGKHLVPLYASIDQGNHCICRSWPGVVIPTEVKATGQQPVAASTTTAGYALILLSILLVDWSLPLFCF